jgi:hypothetical protein
MDGIPRISSKLRLTLRGPDSIHVLVQGLMFSFLLYNNAGGDEEP